MPSLALRAGVAGSAAALELRNHDRLNRYRSDALFPHSKVISGARCHVEDSARHVGPSVLYSDRRLLIVLEVFDSGNSAKRQAAAGRDIRIRIEAAPIGHFAAVELSPVVGCAPTLRPPRMIDDLTPGLDPCAGPILFPTWRGAGAAALLLRGLGDLARPACSCWCRNTVLAFICGFGTEYPAVPEQRPYDEHTQSLHWQFPCHTDALHLVKFNAVQDELTRPAKLICNGC